MVELFGGGHWGLNRNHLSVFLDVDIYSSIYNEENGHTMELMGYFVMKMKSSVKDARWSAWHVGSLPQQSAVHRSDPGADQVRINQKI